MNRYSKKSVSVHESCRYLTLFKYILQYKTCLRIISLCSLWLWQLKGATQQKSYIYSAARYIIISLALTLFCNNLYAQPVANNKTILPGAFLFDQYLPLLKDKKVGLFANHTSVVGGTHVADTLLKLGINISVIFAPEHGFRGNADAGEKIDNYTDRQTGIPVISLYGSKLKPAGKDLANVDILLFDIQDVGVRFYTYISSLQYFMESAIQNNMPLVILDRPNPNGFYIDGPVLDTAFKSFVGMQPVPVVYGMTIGEYAKMLLGEHWLPWHIERKQDDNISLGELLGFEEERTNFSLTVIPCKNYTHKSKYVLPVPPSPNLKDMGAIYWYPSTCFFEGTVLSEGRGTEHPFEIFGHPSFDKQLFAFTPVAGTGAAKPKLMNELCFGWNMHRLTTDSTLKELNGRLQLHWLLQAYKMFTDKESFFLKPQKFHASPTDYFFNKLAGNALLMQQIKTNATENEIRKSWQPGIEAFKKFRKKYLLYADFY